MITLIKTNNSLILVSDEEIKRGELQIYHPSGDLINGKISVAERDLQIDGRRFKVLSQSPKLSKEVADEIGWVDVEELWEDFRIENPNTVGGFKEQYKSFKWCFQKSEELNQKKYSEEDLDKVRLWCSNDYMPEIKSLDELIIFLSQPQQWQVEATEIDGVWNITKILNI